MDEGISNIVLLAVPLFVFLGLLMDTAGIARRLVEALASLVGHVRGGLSIVLVAAMYLVSGISGSKTADMAAVAPVLFPDMEQRGAAGELDDRAARDVGRDGRDDPAEPGADHHRLGNRRLDRRAVHRRLAAGARVVDLALAGRAVRSRNARTDASARAARHWPAIGRAFVVACPALLLPVLIRYSVVAGIATATEVQRVGIVYTMPGRRVRLPRVRLAADLSRSCSTPPR